MHEHLPERRLTGGLRLPAAKETSTAGPIRRGLVPPSVTLSLRQGKGPTAKPVVDVGDRVLRGQVIARGSAPFGTHVHASTSGTVSAIDRRLVPAFGSADTTLCITISADGRDDAVATDTVQWPAEVRAALDAIAAGGIVGLGGAGFPTAAKLAVDGCRMLIVNGAECEPYISCDDMLLREAATDVVLGTAIMANVLSAEISVIAVERDKPEAIEAVHAALAAFGDERIRIAEVPTIYPAGGERQLIDVIAGVEVPSGKLPSDVGFVCQNVGTARAVAELARDGSPLTSRIVTVTGGAVISPGNVEVPIGTPIEALLEFCGGCRVEPVTLIHGGSMMGYVLPSTALPTTKSTNCIIAAAPGELPVSEREWPCIRCGECAIACPARLLPQDLLIAARIENTDDLAALALPDCIECGCCDVICPSHIRLTAAFRHAKTALEKAHRHAQLSEASAERFRRRESRGQDAARAEQRRQEALKKRIDDPDERQAAIAAAVERVRRRRSGDADSGS